MNNNINNAKNITTQITKVVIFMNKKNDKNYESYPVELPSRNNTIKRTPIVDTLDNEIYPMETEINTRHQSGVHIQSFDDISEVVATEIEPEKAEQTIHEQHM